MPPVEAHVYDQQQRIGLIEEPLAEWQQQKLNKFVQEATGEDMLDAKALNQWIRDTFHPGVSAIDILTVAPGLLADPPTLPIILAPDQVTRGPAKDLSKAKFTSVFTLSWFNLFLLGKSNPWKGIPCQM